MEKDFEKLIIKFKKINKLGYVKGINNNINNSCGLTFEKLIGKQVDSMFFPDFDGIEKKFTKRFSRYPISIFTISFNGPSLFESNYLLEKYGEEDKEFKDKKTLFCNLKYKTKVLVYQKYYFELDIDELKEIIYINIYDINYNFIERRGIIDFEDIKDRLRVKLNNLALIYASKRKINQDLYFRYYKIICYKYKGFDYFLTALKYDYVKVSICLRFARTGVNTGKNKNKNMVFKIDKNSVDKLFDRIYLYEN